MEGVRTKIARIVLRHSAASRNAFRMHSSPKPRSKSCGEVLCKSWIWDLPEYPYQSLSKFFRNPRFWSGVLWESWILVFAKNAFWMHSVRMQNAPSTRKNQNQHSAYYPLCVYSHMYIYIYVYIYVVPLEGKPIPKTLQNCPFKTIPKNRHETPQIPVKVIRRYVFLGYHIYIYIYISMGKMCPLVI